MVFYDFFLKQDFEQILKLVTPTDFKFYYQNPLMMNFVVKEP